MQAWLQLKKDTVMAPTLIGVDPKKRAWEQDIPLHNRWHPDIPAVASVKPGQVFRVETIGDARNIPATHPQHARNSC